MRGRKPRPLVLPLEDRSVLQALLRSGKTQQRVAKRADILLAIAQGQQAAPLAQRLAMDEATIRRVCRRYQQRGLKALYDAPRSGRPRGISPPGAGAH